MQYPKETNPTCTVAVRWTSCNKGIAKGIYAILISQYESTIVHVLTLVTLLHNSLKNWKYMGYSQLT